MNGSNEHGSVTLLSKPVGWLSRILGFRYRPRKAYDINRSLTVFECESFDWPTLASSGGGEHHVWRMARNTSQNLLEFISREIVSSEEAVNSSQQDEQESQKLFEKVFGRVENEFRPGDGLKVWKYRDQWHLAKTSVGMPRLTLKRDEWILLRDVLSQILHDTENLPKKA